MSALEKNNLFGMGVVEMVRDERTQQVAMMF
jgi:hypothetical protein